jgi:hypothetical protein
MNDNITRAYYDQVAAALGDGWHHHQDKYDRQWLANKEGMLLALRRVLRTQWKLSAYILQEVEIDGEFHRINPSKGLWPGTIYFKDDATPRYAAGQIQRRLIAHAADPWAIAVESRRAWVKAEQKRDEIVARLAAALGTEPWVNNGGDKQIYHYPGRGTGQPCRIEGTVSSSPTRPSTVNLRLDTIPVELAEQILALCQNPWGDTA